MKQTLLLLLTLCMLCLPLLAEETDDSPWNIYTEIDMYLGFKMGIKYEINDQLDLQTTFGINLIEQTQYCYSAYMSYHTLKEYDKFKIDINFGIIQGVFDITSTVYDDYLFFNPGATIHISYPITDKIRIGAQGGMVLMIGFDQSGWGSSLEPYTGLTFIFSE